MRFFTAVACSIAAAIIALTVSPCFCAPDIAPKAVGYAVVYKFPPITPEMRAKLDKGAISPMFSDLTYGLGGKALVLPNVDGGVVIVENGKAREIPPPPGAEQVGRVGTISADGQTLYYFKPKSANAPANGGTILAIDLVKGSTRSISAMDWEPRFALLSPDGARLADDRSVCRPFKLSLVDLSTGKRLVSEMATTSDAQALALRSFLEKANMWALGWNKSSSAVYVLRNEDGAPSELGIWSVGRPGFSHLASFNGSAGPNTTAISPTGEIVYMNGKAEVCVASGDKSVRRAGKLDSAIMRPQVSPSGKYLLAASTDATGKMGFTVLDLTSGKSYSDLRDPVLMSIQPGTWRPTQDKFLAGFSDDKGNVEIREYKAAVVVPAPNGEVPSGPSAP